MRPDLGHTHKPNPRVRSKFRTSGRGDLACTRDAERQSPTNPASSSLLLYYEPPPRASDGGGGRPFGGAIASGLYLASGDSWRARCTESGHGDEPPPDTSWRPPRDDARGVAVAASARVRTGPGDMPGDATTDGEDAVRCCRRKGDAAAAAGGEAAQGEPGRGGV